MKLGAEPKKVVILGSLLLVAVLIYIMNSSSGGGGGPQTPERPAAPVVRRETPGPVPGQQPQAAASRPTRSNVRALQEFRPSLKPKRPEDRPDPTTVDPTLNLGVLAKLQTVKVEGVRRNIFEFGQAPPPKPDPAKAAALIAKGPKVPDPTVTAPPANTPPAKPTPPPPPPIPLKFYGYINPVTQTAAAKRAFFLEGEDIHVVHEGDVVKRRYRIVRIGVNSVVVEDLEHKHQQTLPLEEGPQA